MRGLVTSSARIIMLATGLLAAVLIVVAIGINEGEIVVLTTTDEQHRSHDTQVWIVELDGEPYLRAGNARVGWLARLRATPTVHLHRDGEESVYRALPQEVDGVRRRLNEAMSEKYGLADRFVGRFIDRSGSIPIRLVPAGDEPPGEAPAHDAGDALALEDDPS